MKIRDEIVN